MLQAFRVIARAVNEFERFGWLYITANLLSVLLSVPLISAPAAFAGLSRLSHTAQTEITASMADFWAGFRQNLLRGLVVGIANAAVLGILWYNFNYYGGQSGLLITVLRTGWIVILILWLGAQLFLWPMLDEMEQPSLMGAIRNAFLMVMQNPLFTLTLMVALLLLAVISTIVFIPWLLVTFSFVACVANAAVLDRLEAYRSGQ